MLTDPILRSILKPILATILLSGGGAPPVGAWILATGLWNDLGVWDDSAVWID